MIVNAKCSSCGAGFEYQMDSAVYANEDIREVELRYAKCPACLEREREAQEAREKESAEAKRRALLAAQYEDRKKASNLEQYYLPYDPADPRGNPELFHWFGEHRNESLWIAGRTGLCKTRITQFYARHALKTQTVQYWNTSDLLNRLAENAKQLTPLLNGVCHAELLILNDLGKENMTPAKSKYLFDIIDKRYIGQDQYRHGYLKRFYGRQLWITTNDNGDALVESLGREAAPMIRRLQETCEVWEQF